LLLASLAYTLMQTIRAVALVGTELARAQCTTIRLVDSDPSRYGILVQVGTGSRRRSGWSH